MKKSKIYLIEKLQNEILNIEFNKRKALDAKYSVRRFAEDAGTDNSTMSKYLKNTRKMTEYIFSNILKKLSVSEGLKEEYVQKILELDYLEAKHSQIRTHWYFYAILELTYLTDFKSNIQWISERLNLDLTTTKNAVDLLIEVGALKVENGNFKDDLGSVTFIESIDMDVEEGRTHQTQLLEKSIESVNNNDSSIKDHTCYSFALDSKLVPEIKQLIADFRGNLAHLLAEKSINNDSVYTVQINLTSLTKNN